MRDSISSGIVALAMVLCCALPVLILSGAFVTGSGLLLNQQTLLSLGIILIVLITLGGLSWFLLRRRNH
jgi:hypothetical protein